MSLAAEKAISQASTVQFYSSAQPTITRCADNGFSKYFQQE